MMGYFSGRSKAVYMGFWGAPLLVYGPTNQPTVSIIYEREVKEERKALNINGS